MKCNEHFAIIGGDIRQKFLYDIFTEKSISLSTYGVYATESTNTLHDALTNTTSVILPIPYTKDGEFIFSILSDSAIPISEIIKELGEGQTIYGGCFDENFKNKCQEKGIETVDFMDDDTFELQNSIATAEGTITEAIIHSHINLHKSKCLVLGYGKCSNSICSRLKSLNVFVTVCARNKVAQIKAFEAGHKYIGFNELSKYIGDYDFIFNTVPSLVLTKNILSKVKKDVTIIDIASKPGGTDFDACKSLMINAHLCLGLPGKYSPKTSAKIIYDSIVQN